MRTLIVTWHVRASAQAIPLAAGCIRAALPAEMQQQTEIVNLYPGPPLETLCQQLLAREPAVVAFSVAVWSRQPLLQLARLLRQHRPDLMLLAGGPETAGDCRRIIDEGQLDGVIRGEGEQAFATWLHRLTNNQPTSDIAGLFSAEQTPAAAVALCPDLTQLPSPWLTGQLPLEDNGAVLWEVARGCHFNCAFCYDAKGVKGVRALSFERLRQELELFTAAGISQIWILDSTFNAPPERGHKLLKLLIEVAPQIHYHIEAKADFLDQQTMELLSQLSCSVQIGLQSARPEILKPLHRHLNLKQTRRVLTQLNQAGVVFGLDLIYGLPGDNHAGFVTSLDFALQQQPNQVDIFPLALLPGTELHHRQQEFGLCGQTTPPYLVVKNSGYPQKQLQQSALLAAATDIFYNRGRAVGFFLQCCAALTWSPATMLTQFLDWLGSHSNLSSKQILAVENWTPDKILPLQRDFISEQLHTQGRAELVPVAQDLILYHYLCAETLLADHCQASPELHDQHSFAKARWQLNPAVHIGHFHFDLEQLEAVGAQPLSAIRKQLAEDPGQVLFMNQYGSLVIESLAEPFAQLLLAATTPTTGAQLLHQLDPDDAEELTGFALGQGLLLPVI